MDWWKHHKASTTGFKRYGTLRQGEAAWDDDIRFIRGTTGRDFRDKTLNYGGNSGFQIVHLAIIWGAERVLLLGYDMGCASPSERHWFGVHPGSMDKKSNYEGWVTDFTLAAKSGHNIINCSRETALTCFPRAVIQDVI